MISQIRREITAYVAERRMAHIHGTEEECCRLSEIFSLSSEDAKRLSVAALLHDMTKRLTREEHLAYAAAHGCTLDEETLRSDKTLHAVTGAHMARERYPEIVDDAIYTAIRFHTTGRADMTLLEKLLYLADYIEPTRTFPDCVKLRECFYERVRGADDRRAALDEILLLSFDMTVTDLVRQRRPIHRDTVEARNYLLEQERT